MTYGRNTFGRSLYGSSSTLEVVAPVDLESTVVAEAVATADLSVAKTLAATATATATATAELKKVISLAGTATMTFAPSAAFSLIVPPSDPPEGYTLKNLRRISPVMPTPVLVDGKPT